MEIRLKKNKKKNNHLNGKEKPATKGLVETQQLSGGFWLMNGACPESAKAKPCGRVVDKEGIENGKQRMEVDTGEKGEHSAEAGEF